MSTPTQEKRVQRRQEFCKVIKIQSLETCRESARYERELRQAPTVPGLVLGGYQGRKALGECCVCPLPCDLGSPNLEPGFLLLKTRKTSASLIEERDAGGFEKSRMGQTPSLSRIDPV